MPYTGMFQQCAGMQAILHSVNSSGKKPGLTLLGAREACGEQVGHGFQDGVPLNFPKLFGASSSSDTHQTCRMPGLRDSPYTYPTLTAPSCLATLQVVWPDSPQLATAPREGACGQEALLLKF